MASTSGGDCGRLGRDEDPVAHLLDALDDYALSSLETLLDHLIRLEAGARLDDAHHHLVVAAHHRDLEHALQDCKAKGNCDQVREEFRLRDAANSARLAACTTDCAAIRDELDAGSQALKTLWESDNTGITDEFLRNNINEWSSAGPRVADQVGQAAWRGDSTALTQLGQYLDQQGFNPFGINPAGLVGLGSGTKTGAETTSGAI